jgi:hypothetical protein
MSSNTPSVEVRPVRAGRGVFALRDIDVGEEILVFAGRVVGAPNRRTLQLSDTEHLDVPAGLSEAELEARHPWRYLNHGCRPNGKLAGHSLIAVAPIPTGAEVVFNYETTEWDMAEPFTCGCDHCGGRHVRGARHLGDEERAELRALMRPRLLERLARQDQPET